MRIRLYETGSVFKRLEAVKRLRFLTNGGSEMLKNFEAHKTAGLFLSGTMAKLLVGFVFGIVGMTMIKGIGGKIVEKARDFAAEMNWFILPQG